MTVRQFFTVAALAVVNFCVSAQNKSISNLPTLEINTTDGANPYDKNNYLDCSVRRIDGSTATDFGQSRIRLRGNSTAGLEKKPYRLKFYQKVRFMGSDRANAKNWVLLANYTDKTLIRNAVAFRIAEIAGGMPFVPATEFVDLQLNGKYRGNYHLTDHIDIRKKRVNITEQDTVPGAGHDISGGYLLEVDGIGYREDVNFSTRCGLCVVVKSPDVDVISREQLSYIEQFVQDVETRVTSSYFKDPEKGYRAVVDSLSLASWYITNELAGNPDTFWSNYMYKEKGDSHLYFGPVWDFDIAFNNCTRKGDMSNKLMKDYGFDCQSRTVGQWINKMWEDPWFQQLIWRTWKQMVNDGIEQQLLDYIDELAETLNESQALNFGLYDISQRVYDEYVLFNTYTAGIDYLKEQVRARVELLTVAFSKLANVKDPNPDPEPEPDPNPEPEPGEIQFSVPQDGGVYAIYNHGVDMPLTLGSAGNVVLGKISPNDSIEFSWELRAVDNQNYMLIHQGTDMAMTDTSGGVLEKYITLSEPDSTDPTQLWQFYEVDSNLHTYYVVNKDSNLAWNNSKGYAQEGNPLIAWTNDSQNSLKITRQWKFALISNSAAGDDDNHETDAILDPMSPNYVVSFSPSLRQLRFTAYSSEPMSGTWVLYTITGAMVASGDIAPEVSIPAMPSATYILSWQTAQHRHSMKLAL